MTKFYSVLLNWFKDFKKYFGLNFFVSNVDFSLTAISVLDKLCSQCKATKAKTKVATYISIHDYSGGKKTDSRSECQVQESQKKTF